MATYKNKERHLELTIDGVLLTLAEMTGIGKTTETRLKLAGYTTLRDLLAHPRWAWQVEQILAAVGRRDLPALNRFVTRWFPLSHPIAFGPSLTKGHR
ncbi:MAG: hypothetical protein NZ651_05255 [Candidatus Bipolaricaulota bacterium]|nr:hypothetical protein [Candidatus Bipolaricaulota bacterium]MDW8127160.1 hypothetical protein [Candidatus Bipolaricaulota bacterium]